MPVMTKREKAARALFDEEKPYPVEEALEIVKKLPAAKFDESVDMSLRLGVDPQARRSDGAGCHRAPARNRQDGAGGGIRQG